MQCGRLCVQRTVELLALPLVRHLVGVTNTSHLVHKAFIEHSGKTFSGDCMSLTCIFIADKTNTRSCCSHPCTCHSLQVLWLLWRKVSLQDAARFSLIWHPPTWSQRLHKSRSSLVLGNCLMDHLPWDRQSVGYCLLPQVQLGNKRFSALFKQRVQPNSARYFS